MALRSVEYWKEVERLIDRPNAKRMIADFKAAVGIANTIWYERKISPDQAAIEVFTSYRISQTHFRPRNRFR